MDPVFVDPILEVHTADMILSVKDAKEKWCPMGGRAFPGGNAVDKCIGPDCMMWCSWASSLGASSNADIPLFLGNKKEWTVADERGYCGLPGSYLKEQKFFCGL